MKMNLKEIVIPCKIKTNNHNARDKLIIMIEGQYEQEPLNEEDVPREPYGDNDEDFYDDENLANKDMENPVISGKSYGYVMEDYLGAPLNTMVEVFKDINDDELQV